jgi:hypothetical protein
MFALDEIQYYPNNWVDGMRISAKEFQATDHAWQDAIRDVRASILQGGQYGLLPSLRVSNDKSMYPKFRYEPQKALLTLLECRAITEGGYRVEITENGHQNLRVPLTLPSTKIDLREDFEVYISVEMFEKQAAGQQSESAPPRNLLSAPLYELSILPKGIGLSGLNHLQIAEFKYTAQGIKPDDKYLPHCMMASAHPKLWERHLYLGGLLKSLYENGLNLYKQYAFDARPEVRQAAGWVEKWVLSIGNTLWTFNETLPHQSPRMTVIYIKNLAQLGLTCIDMYDTNEFLRNAARSQRPLFNNIVAPSFTADNLREAYDGMDEFVNGWLRWCITLSESLKQGREIRVEVK